MKNKIMNILKAIARPFVLALKKMQTAYDALPNKKKKAIQGYLYITPWLIGFAFFGVYQLFISVRMSLADVAKYIVDLEKGASKFVMEGFGFTQYVEIFKNNPSHVDTILSVITDIAIVVPLVIVFALILALLLKKKIKGQGIFRTIFFIPVILLSGNLLGYFSEYGLLTMPGVASGKIAEAISFYFPEKISEVIMFAFNKIVLILWLSGVQTIIFLAGLNKIDKSVYESASIEGASGWDAFWKITLPAISNLIIINIVYTTIIYSNLSNNNLVLLINETMLSANFGRDYASALSWILFGIELSIIGVYALIIKLIFKSEKRR